MDKGASDDSFVTVPGNIRSTQPLKVTDPITFYKDSTWTIKLITENIVTKGGYIKVEVPEVINMNPSTSVSGGSCRKWSCPEKMATKKEIWFLINEDLPANKEITIDIVGIDNPRTTKPTGVFHVTTYNQDKVSKIDEGYDSNTQMSFLGELGTFTSTQTNFVNGVKNKYIFSMQSNIPLLPGDKLSY